MTKPSRPERRKKNGERKKKAGTVAATKAAPKAKPKKQAGRAAAVKPEVKRSEVLPPPAHGVVQVLPRQDNVCYSGTSPPQRWSRGLKALVSLGVFLGYYVLSIWFLSEKFQSWWAYGVLSVLVLIISFKHSLTAAIPRVADLFTTLHDAAVFVALKVWHFARTLGLVATLFRRWENRRRRKSGAGLQKS